MIVTTSVSGNCRQKFRQFVRRHEMLLGGESVLIAVSGGIDSMTLLDIMARLAPIMKLQLGVAYFDHELRGEESHEDANFVTEQAKNRGLKVYIGHGDVKRLAAERKLSIEDAARRARYYFLERIARRHNYSIVMTGHNADDNAETVLLNLLRGSGVTGLAGMPAVRPLGKGVTVVRPLLWAGRQEIETYAGEVGIEWREDETNRSVRFTRNRIRHELLPVLKEYNPAIVGTLNSTANIMRGVEQFLGHSVRTAVQRVVISRSPESVELNLSQLRHYLPAIQAELVQRVVSKNFESAPIPYSAVERVLGLIWKESGSKAELVGGISVMRDRETLTIRRDPPPFVPTEKTFEQGDVVDLGRQRLVTKLIANEGIQFSNKRHIEYLDADRLPKQLIVRSWREGDRFRPLGMEGEKKLSDFLIDIKMPVDKKRDVLVVADGDTIAWVCGYRIDERFKVTPETASVLKLELLSGGDGRYSGGESRKSGGGQSDRGRGPRRKPSRDQAGPGKPDQPESERSEQGRAGRGQPEAERRQQGQGQSEGRRSDSRPSEGKNAEGEGGGRGRPESERGQGQSQEARPDRRQPERKPMDKEAPGRGQPEQGRGRGQSEGRGGDRRPSEEKPGETQGSGRGRPESERGQGKSPEMRPDRRPPERKPVDTRPEPEHGQGPSEGRGGDHRPSEEKSGETELSGRGRPESEHGQGRSGRRRPNRRQSGRTPADTNQSAAESVPSKPNPPQEDRPEREQGGAPEQVQSDQARQDQQQPDPEGTESAGRSGRGRRGGRRGGGRKRPPAGGEGNA